MSDITLQSLAGEAYDWFTTEKRGDETIVTLKDSDERPEWVHDLVYAAHGEFLPDDWRYASIRSALGAISDDFDGDEIDDFGAQWSDGNVATYTHARLQWLASNLSRTAYCDDARDEYGEPQESGITALIGLGMYAESREVFDAVRSALESELEARQDDDGPREGESA